MSAERRQRAALVGAGFIAAVHIEALWRLGVEVVGLCDETPEAARAKADFYGLPRAYESLAQLLADPGIDVVHITTPNHLHYEQVKEAVGAGKHVVCEKPLGLDAAQAAELVELAGRAGVLHCTNFNLRYYPSIQEARHRVSEGAVGEVWDVHGSYLQDWLLYPTDWNWRLETGLGGRLRAVADIGSHWFDVAQFVSGRAITAVMADLFTAVPRRQRPSGPTETFAAGGGGVEEVEIETEDVAHVLVRFEGGARGAVVISQVAAGRRNSLSVEIDGSAGSLAWTSERCEELWLGHRDRPNELLLRDPNLMGGPVTGSLPGGHPEGFADASRELYRAFYRAVAAGEPQPGYPTFVDGWRANAVADAVLRSAETGAWAQPDRGPGEPPTVPGAEQHG